MNFRLSSFTGSVRLLNRPQMAVLRVSAPQQIVVMAEPPRRPGGPGRGGGRGRGPGGPGRGSFGGRGRGPSGPYRKPEEGSTGEPRPQRERPPRPQRGETLMDRMRDGRGAGGLQMNQKITAPEVRVMDDEKEPLGIFPTSEALQMARDAGLDLILIVPDASPPVARMMELSRYKFEQEKAAKESRKRQKAGQQELKEIRLRPNTDVHDYQVKLRKAEEFIVKDGDNCKITVSMKGREMMFKSQAEEMLKRFIADLGDRASVMIAPKLGGNAWTMTLAPAKGKPAAAGAPKPKAPRPAAEGGAEAAEEDSEDEEEEEEEEGAAAEGEESEGEGEEAAAVEVEAQGEAATAPAPAA